MGILNRRLTASFKAAEMRLAGKRAPVRWLLLLVTSLVVAGGIGAALWFAAALQTVHNIVTVLGWSKTFHWVVPASLGTGLFITGVLCMRRPLLGSIPIGVLLALLGSWVCMAHHVLPSERLTQARMQAAQTTLDASYEREGSYPKPGENNTLSMAAGAGTYASVPALDAFGHALVYETSGQWLMQAYRLRSLGFDGVRSFDDLCVSGSTPMGSLLDKLRQLQAIAGLVKELVVQDPSTGVAHWLASINELSCPQRQSDH